MPPRITCAYALPGKKGKRQKSHFSLKWCVSALPELHQLLDFLNLLWPPCVGDVDIIFLPCGFFFSFLVDSQLIIVLLYDSLNLVVRAFSSALLGGWFRINEVQSAAEVGLCCTHNALVCCVLGFYFAEVLDRWGGKQNIWFLTFSLFPVTLLPKNIVIGSCMSRL